METKFLNLLVLFAETKGDEIEIEEDSLELWKEFEEEGYGEIDQETDGAFYVNLTEKGENALRDSKIEVVPIPEDWEPSDPPEYILTMNQRRFVFDAELAELTLCYDYSGRGMFGRICPGVTVGHPSVFQTTSTTSYDNMGYDYIVYASH